MNRSEAITREIDAAEVLPAICTRVRDLERDVRVWRRVAMVLGAVIAAGAVAVAG